MIRDPASRLQLRVSEVFSKARNHLVAWRRFLLEVVVRIRLSYVGRRIDSVLSRSHDKETGQLTAMRLGDVALRVRCHEQTDIERVLERLNAEGRILCFDENLSYIDSPRRWMSERLMSKGGFAYGQAYEDFWNLRVMRSPYYSYRM